MATPPNRRAESYVVPPIDFVLVASGEVGSTIALPTNCRGLLVGTAGFLDVSINGNARNGLPFIAGVNPGFFTEVRASVGGAQNVWAVV